MLDREPFIYPARNRYVYDPGIPDKQLWAIGMVVVQWSATEWFLDTSTRQFVKDDPVLIAEYERLRGFQLRLGFWRAQIELKTKDPYRSQALALVSTIQALNAQRDEVVHRLWGGGMEAASPSADGLPTTDAGMLPEPGEPIKGKGPMIPFKWGAGFIRLRRMATEMADLNRALFSLMFLPNAPHGHVHSEGQTDSR